MQTFATADGKNYVIRLNIGTIRRVREETGVDLLDPTGERTQPAASDLLRTDLVKIGEVIAAIVQPEIPKDQFLEQLEGQVLRAACKAFWEEWSGFFLEAGDELLGNQIREIYDATCELAKAAAKKTKALFKRVRERMHEDLNADIDRAMKDLEPHGIASGSEPASSESSPGPSP